MVRPYEGAISVDNNGEFSLALPAEKNLSLLITAPNFATQVITVYSPSEGGITKINATLIKVNNEIIISDEGITTYVADTGATVTFDKADFVDDNNNAIIGDIQLTITPIDVSKPATMPAFPGSFSGLAQGDSEPSEIISLGAVEYNFTQNGSPVNLALGKTAEILLPIYVNTYQDATSMTIGDVIPLWSLNEDTGIWLQEGHGEIVAPNNSTTGFAMRAVVSHFTWWNASIIAQPAYLEITVLGESSGNATITGQAELPWGLTNVVIDIGGTSDRLPIPSNTEVCFLAYLSYDSGDYSIYEKVCTTASLGQVIAITLKEQSGDELDVITNPIGDTPDVLNVYTAVNEAIPISIAPLTAESFIDYQLNGALPPGLSLVIPNLTAYIVGTPTTTGTYPFTITATDNDGGEDIIEFQYFVQEANSSINLSFNDAEKIGLTLGLFSGTATINWNDGSELEIIHHANTQTYTSFVGASYTEIYHEYDFPRTGSISIEFSDGHEAVRTIGSTNYSAAYNHFNFDVFELSKLSHLLQINFDSTNALTGDIAAINNTVKSLTIKGDSSSLMIDIDNLPGDLVYLDLPKHSNVTGNLSDLPRQLESLFIGGPNTVSGDISLLPTGLDNVYLTGENTVSGDISSLPSAISSLYLSGLNTVNGNINTLPAGLRLYLYGENTVTGDIGLIPEGIFTELEAKNFTIYTN